MKINVFSMGLSYDDNFFDGVRELEQKYFENSNTYGLVKEGERVYDNSKCFDYKLTGGKEDYIFSALSDDKALTRLDSHLKELSL